MEKQYKTIRVQLPTRREVEHARIFGIDLVSDLLVSVRRELEDAIQDILQDEVRYQGNCEHCPWIDSGYACPLERIWTGKYWLYRPADDAPKDCWTKQKNKQ